MALTDDLDRELRAAGHPERAEEKAYRVRRQRRGRRLAPHYGRHVRVEHWATAREQGAVAGRNAAGTGANEVYDHLPSFFSDQYDVGLEYVGLPGDGDGDGVVLRGDPATGPYLAFWHRDGVVTAAMHVNTWDAIDHLRGLVA